VRRCSRSSFVLSRVIPDTRRSANWANREGTCVVSCGERTRSVRRYRDANREAEGIRVAIWRKALSDRYPEFFAGFRTDQMAKDLRNFWRQPARRISRNWLLYMALQRAGRGRPLDLSGTCHVSQRARRKPERAAANQTRREKAAVFATGIRAHQHGRKPIAAQSGGRRPGRGPRSARRFLARQPNKEARPDPTTEFEL
jgi:hypothetical protein